MRCSTGWCVVARFIFFLYTRRAELAELRKSVHAIYIGRMFVGCVLYAADIIFMSFSCNGLEHAVSMEHVGIFVLTQQRFTVLHLAAPDLSHLT